MTKYIRQEELVPSALSIAVPVEYRNEGSNLLNYGDYYDEYDNLPEVECRACHGTGLDRDEEFDCLACGGEGYVPAENSLAGPLDIDATDP